MTVARGRNLYLLVALLLGACAAPTSPARPAGGVTEAPSSSAPPQTLVFISRNEVDNMAALSGVGTGTGTLRRFFNATLTAFDDRGLPQPFLAEALPQLNTESWKVQPDGRMETTYRLRPNLTWHDGVALTADDFVFAYRVYMNPDLQKGSPKNPPQSLIEQLRATDDRTLVIDWSRSFADAGVLGEEFRPLPRHILEPVLQQADPSAFDNNSYWTTAFVGLGPFRVDRWDPGAVIEGVAFDGYVFGRPKLDRVRVLFNSDPNAVVANLLAGSAHLVADTTLRFQSAVVLKREWEARGGGGTVYFTPFQVRYAQIQQRPDLANPRAVLDVRARRALAFATDRQGLVDGLFEGQGIVADTLVPRNADHYAAVDQAIAKYPYDPRRAEQLLNELGFTRGADGFFASPTDGQFTPEWRATGGGDSETQLAILVDGLRRAGIDARSYIFPQIQDDDREARASFPGLSNTSTTGVPERWYRGQTTSEIPSAANFWNGTNRGGWSNDAYSQIYRTFSSTLDRSELNRQVVEMTRVLSEQVGVIPLYYNLDVAAQSASLQAPRLVAPDASIGWNIQEWQLR